MEQTIHAYRKLAKNDYMTASSFGLVAYARPEYYKDTYDENMVLNMPVTIHEFIEALELFFNDKLQNSTTRVQNILVGQLHGAGNGRAHFQCMIELTAKGRLIKEAGEILIDDVIIPVMYQPVKDRKKLILYCQKSEQFEWLHEFSIEPQE